MTQSSSKTSTTTGKSSTVTLGAKLEESTKLYLVLANGVPPAAVIDEPLQLTIEGDTVHKTQTTTVQWPVAGAHQFRPARLTASNGLFSETISHESSATVIVEPPTPRNIHIGAGGTRVSLVQGEHETGRVGSGLELAELREYTAGDSAGQIDWKATARLATPHVRTYKAETDRPTMIVIDHRDHLAMGPVGETKLDYLREIGLTIAASAQQLGDPLGYISVGNGGITSRIQPTTGVEAYTRIRRELLELEPSELAVTTRSQRSTQTGLDTRTTEFTELESRSQRGVSTSPDSALAVLTSREDEFARQLRPFYEKQIVYKTRIQTDPFATAVESVIVKPRRNTHMVLCTDDSNPSKLKATVRSARARF
ncbi:DUF58 domain-containing protein [Halostagnicola sp. A56]|uniref:DUF58 domain-containing protein n=1 Tax=Halostagnicola sp. A56 TaxID=1495067 RepID=UPI0018CFE01D|nr:DUF58 domain-containing protein [Halostagnicola sp. A56]